MTNNMVLDFIRRSNRRLMIISNIGLALMITAVPLFSRYLYNFAFGPFTINKEAVLANPDWRGQQKYFVNITGDDILDTGYRGVRTYKIKKGSKSIREYYQGLILSSNTDDKYMLVKLTGLSKATQFVGALIPISNDIRREMLLDIEQDFPHTKGQFLQVMLNTDNFRTPGFIGIPIGVIIGALSLIGLSRALSRNNDPLKHPIMRDLARYGDPQTLADQIDKEMRGEHPRLGKIHFTRTWLIEKRALSLDIMRLQDVVWLYKSVTKRSTHGIPTGKTFAALIWDRYGKCVTLYANKKTIDEILSAAYSRCPWAVPGWSVDLQAQYNKEREAFATQVDRYRQQIMAQQQI